jgi:two-component system sensor histidine kinase HydH
MQITQATEHPTTSGPAERRMRWWGAGAGVALAAVDTLTLAALGIDFQMNGRNVGLLVAVFFGSSFALLGYLLGAMIEARRRDRRAAAVIRAQVETISAARARLVQSEKLAALGQLATAIAHEVRNPLAIIRSAAQGLGESASPDDAEAHRACSFITAEIDRLSNVIGALLAFARPPQLAARAVPVRDLFDRALLLADEELRATGLRVRRQEPIDLPAVNADPDLVCQVLLGLLANAVAAVPPGGEVGLEARRADGAVELAVADSGPGVAPELRERIFEPFFTTRPRGTGLGLAVARQIVEAHGGKIDVRERAGGGARFVIRLPAAAGAAIAA